MFTVAADAWVAKTIDVSENTTAIRPVRCFDFFII